MTGCIHEVWCSVAKDEHEGKCRIFVEFNDSDRADVLSEYGYDEIVHLLDQVLPEGWSVDDAPECEAEADEDTSPHITFELNNSTPMIYTVHRKLLETDIIPVQ